MAEQTSSHRGRHLLAPLAFCLLTVAVLAAVSAVLTPSRSILRGDGGAAWAGYLAQPRNTVDVVFFGNSHTFDGIDPSQIWRSSGVTSYVLGGPVQTPQVMKYYVMESLRTQHPRVIALEMSTVAYGKRNYAREFQQINVGYMPWGLNKLDAALLATPAGDRLGTVLDLWTYHGRWGDLWRSRSEILAKAPDDAFMKGFLPRFGSRTVTATPAAVPSSNPAVDRAMNANMAAYDDIVAYCRARNVQVLLFLTPTGPPNTYTYELRRATRILAARYDNVRALDLSVLGAVPDLSFKKDFISGGHVSTTGSEKMSRVLGAYLAGTYKLGDHRADPRFAFWNGDAARVASYLAAHAVRR